MKTIQLQLSFQEAPQKGLGILLSNVKCAIKLAVSCQKVAVLTKMFLEGSTILTVLYFCDTSEVMYLLWCTFTSFRARFNKYKSSSRKSSSGVLLMQAKLDTVKRQTIMEF